MASAAVRDKALVLQLLIHCLLLYLSPLFVGFCVLSFFVMQHLPVDSLFIVVPIVCWFLCFVLFRNATLTC